MSHAAPSLCPVCTNALVVTRLACDGCGTAIEGRFSLGRLGRLSREQLELVEVFLVARGKIKDVEAALGISYPTVVSRLDALVAALGSPLPRDDAKAAPTGSAASETDDVLDALARGELTPDQAARRLKRGK